ncbi:MAG: kinase [Gammaproteobacteria bacterium]|nr:MAG: kinase [Gammaproteobacteria bacterium]
MAAALAVCCVDEVRVLGISGGQGAGKSTLASLLVMATEALGRRAISVSLDDFYLSRAERQALARDVHPLLATRGVPGTHDVALACQTLDSLLAAGDCQVPAFDKSVDDRAALGRTVSGPFDLVVFEGWCVGVPSEPAARLVEPINDLERTEDPDGRWRAYVNGALENDYPALWARLETLLFLKVPDMAAVIRWRTQQEQAHPAERRMTDEAIARFVAHYERLTRWMTESMSVRADLLALLDDEHRLVGIVAGRSAQRRAEQRN